MSTVIVQGLTLDELMEKMREAVRQEIQAQISAAPASAKKSLLGRTDVAELLSVHPKYFDAHIRNKRGFPKPVNDTGAPRWRRAEVVAWIERKG